MSRIEVIHVKDARRLAKSFRFQAVIYVGRDTMGMRGSPLGNPFKISAIHDRARVIKLYEAWLRRESRAGNVVVNMELMRIATLYKERGSIMLSCWCAPLPCHADVIKSVIEELVGE